MLAWLVGAALNLGAAPSLPQDDTIAARLRTTLQTLQERYVDQRTGWVDYNALATSPLYADVQTVATSLQAFRPERLTRPERLAFWLNTYNALVIHGLIAHGQPTSLETVPAFFTDTAYRIGGTDINLDEIEQGVLTGNKPAPGRPSGILPAGDARLTWLVTPPEPRVHFALVCGAASCPPVRFYDAANIDQQLDLAAASFLNGPAVTIVPKGRQLRVSQILQWYADDFGGRVGLRRLFDRYLDASAEKQDLMSHWDQYTWTYDPYDWRLNAVHH